jgi:DNA-binding transcriptional LysR family regulator
LNTSFDWGLIRSFLAALEHGSLLAAARAVNASQPTLGRHIAELESQLGTALFERTGRGLKPTAMALQLAESARAMELGAHKLARTASGANERISGSVRITASQPVACVLLPPILARMREALPDVQVELVSSNELSNLLRREADIAVRMVRPDQTSLISKRIGEVPICACAHERYLARKGIPIEPEDLLRHELIGGDRQEDIQRGFARFGLPLERERFAFRTDDLMAYWAAVCAGLGVGFTASYLVRGEPEVRALLPQLKVPPLPMWLTVHREIRTSRRFRAVYDFLAQALPAAL